LIVMDLHQRPDYSKRPWWQNPPSRKATAAGKERRSPRTP
jgi:hypothetical protein